MADSRLTKRFACTPSYTGTCRAFTSARPLSAKRCSGGLTGWVRNRWDGTVEVVAEGPRSALTSFEIFLHQGHPALT